MRPIRKRGEPGDLQRYRRSRGEPAPTYGDMPSDVKASLRDALVGEQGWLCCYCMRRITSDDCRIEHWQPQSKYPGRQLHYRNLFAACSGDLGGESHCDVSKADREIGLDPLTVDPRWFGYRRDGMITTARSEHAGDIDATLVLNTRALMHARKSTLAAFLRAVGPKGSQWSTDRLRKALERVTAPDGPGRIEPFCEVLADWIERRLKRA